MNDTPAKKQIITYLKRRCPEIEDKSIPSLLNDIRRFVTVVQKIYTEPQAQIRYKEKKVRGKIEKYRVFDTDYEELLKVRGKNEKTIPLTEAVKRLQKSVIKDNYGR